MKKNFLKLLIIIALVLIFAIIILKLLNNKVMPIYMNYATSEMKSLVTTVINKSLNEDLIANFDTNSFFIIESDNNTNTTMVDFDPLVLNRFISDISDIIYNNLKLISEGDTATLKKYNVSESIFYIPSGLAFNSVGLNNLGPKIPIKMELISSVNPKVETKVTEYGINNSLIEVFVSVVVDIKMVLPMSSNNMQVSVLVPVSVKLIQGMVPDYYLGNLLENKNTSN